jgi:hypothetical protein
MLKSLFSKGDEEVWAISLAKKCLNQCLFGGKKTHNNTALANITASARSIRNSAISLFSAFWGSSSGMRKEEKESFKEEK